MVSQVLVAKILVRSILLTVLICWYGSASAQVRFHTSTPIIDSFPVVKADISVSVAGKPAPFDKTHLSILEDGSNITEFELINCVDANTASVAVLVDVSESMRFTLYTGDDEYYQSYRDFINKFGPGSEIALFPFNDTVSRIIPPKYHPGQDYFDTGDPEDVQEFIDSVGGLLFLGRTDVDFAIWTAAQHLKKAKNERRSIVLITDDAIYDYEGLIELLRQEDISLFVMEMDGDTITGNIRTADGTGGKFFSAEDSSMYSPIMTEIADMIFSKRCQVRYVSDHPCPWWSQKILWFGLNYQGTNLAQTHYFTLGPNVRDSIAPLLTETKISEPARRIKAEEDFPCQRGIRTFEDSALVNFAKISRVRKWPDLAYDSIVVIDPSQPASGFYIATDSSGNTTRIYISYTPANDELPPVWSLPFRTTSDQFQLVATELRKGDRGLKSISLVPGAVNLRMDSVVFLSHRVAQAYVSRINPALEATGCIIAVDSVNNDSMACVEFNVGVKDFNPPAITQRPLSSPFLTMTADVTELKPDDEGIESISVTPITNVGVSSISFTSPFIAVATTDIIDSFYLAEAIVTALDSAGNSSQFTLRYSPQPDTKAPVGVTAVDGATSRTVTITEEQPWDRGLKSVIVAQSANVTPTQTADARRLNIWTVSSIDPLTIGSLTLEATDSADNSIIIDVIIPAQTKPELKPLTYSDPLDFGTLSAPAYRKLSIEIANPNDEPIRLTNGTWAKDDSVFSLVEIYPIDIAPNSTQSLAFEYEPQLLGDWTAVHTFETEDGKKYPIVMTGSSIGSIHITASNESVLLSGDKGVLTLALSGTPITTNADTIMFSIELDRDVATLDAPSSDCSNTPWLCNYDLSWEDRADRYAVTLARRSSTRSLVLSGAPTIEIPFSTYFAAEPTTTVQLSEGYGSRSSITSTPGSITVGEACGETFVRSLLRGELLGGIIALAYDRTSDKVDIEIESQVEGMIVVQLVDVNGIVHSEQLAAATSGTNKLEIPTSGLASGKYHVVLRTESSSLSRAFTIVR